MRDYGTGTWEGGSDPACDHKAPPRYQKTDSSTLGRIDGYRDNLPADNAAYRCGEQQYRGTCGKCGARRVDRQLGLEATPEAYVEAMVRVFRLVRVALADHGTCWINLGSTYASGDRNASRSPLPAHGLPCGSDSKEPQGSPTADRACPGSDDEPQGEISSHHGRSADISPLRGQCEPRHVPTGHDSERPDCGAVLSDAAPLDVQESTTPSSSPNVQAASCPSGAVSASRKSRRKASPGVLPSERKAANIPGKASTSSSSTGRIEDKGSGRASACGRSDCQGWGRCGLCWCSLAIPSLNIKAGDQIDIPQLVKFALQADGWICRSVIVWKKASPMPQSLAGTRWMRHRIKLKGGEYGEQVRPRDGANRDGHLGNGQGRAEWQDCPGCDKCRPNGGLVLRRGSWRPTSSYEPILMLAKQPGYFADGESVKTDGLGNPGRPYGSGWAQQRAQGVDTWEYTDGSGGNTTNGIGGTLPASGANLRDVWTIAAEPLSEKHYAAFPTELVYRCLAAGTSQRGYCPQCGAPWARVVETVPRPGETRGVEPAHRRTPVGGDQSARVTSVAGFGIPGQACLPTSLTTTLGWRPTCPHGDLPPRPGLVLDPFAGSQRVGLQAIRMGLDYIGIELSSEYCRLGEKLIREASPLFCDLEGAP